MCFLRALFEIFAHHINFAPLQPQIHFPIQTPKQEPSNTRNLWKSPIQVFPFTNTGVQDTKATYTIIILDKIRFYFSLTITNKTATNVLIFLKADQHGSNLFWTHFVMFHLTVHETKCDVVWTSKKKCPLRGEHDFPINFDLETQIMCPSNTLVQPTRPQSIIPWRSLYDSCLRPHYNNRTLTWHCKVRASFL